MVTQWNYYDMDTLQLLCYCTTEAMPTCVCGLKVDGLKTIDYGIVIEASEAQPQKALLLVLVGEEGFQVDVEQVNGRARAARLLDSHCYLNARVRRPKSPTPTQLLQAPTLSR